MIELRVSEDMRQATGPCECIWLEVGHALCEKEGPDWVRIGARWRGRAAQITLDGLQGLDGRLHPHGLALLPEGIRRLLLLEAIESWRKSLPVPLREVELVLLPQESLGMARVDLAWPLQIRCAGVPQWSCGALQLSDASPAAQLAWAKLFASAGWPMPPLSTSMAGEIHVGSVELLLSELEQLEPGDWVALQGYSHGRDGIRADFVPFDSAGSHQPVFLRRQELKLDEGRRASPSFMGFGDSPMGRTDGPVCMSVTSEPIDLPLAWLCDPCRPLVLPSHRRSMRWWLVHDKVRRAEMTWQVIGRRPGFRVTALAR